MSNTELQLLLSRVFEYCKRMQESAPLLSQEEMDWMQASLIVLRCRVTTHVQWKDRMVYAVAKP